VQWCIFDVLCCIYALSTSPVSKYLSVLMIVGRNSFIIVHSDSQLHVKLNCVS
jgi:hypothetical protein